VKNKLSELHSDFRVNSIQPTTVELLDQLGLIHEFNELHHSRLHGLILHDKNTGPFQAVDIGRLNVKYPYIAMAPQWDFLNLLASAGATEPTFRLIMDAEFINFLYSDNTITGVRYTVNGTTHDLHAR